MIQVVRSVAGSKLVLLLSLEDEVVSLVLTMKCRTAIRVTVKIVQTKRELLHVAQSPIVHRAKIAR